MAAGASRHLMNEGAAAPYASEWRHHFWFFVLLQQCYIGLHVAA